MTSETFVADGSLAADFAIPENWSGGVVPGLGTMALIAQVVVSVDPAATLSAGIVLEGGVLSGDGGAFSLGVGSAVQAEGEGAALYADGAIVSHGVISVDTDLRVVVENGAAGIAQDYGLTVPSFDNEGRITVAAGATLAVDGTEFSNQGQVAVAGGTLLVAGGGVDGGQGFAPDGGVMTLGAGAYVAFGDAVADQTVSFTGAATLAIADAHDVTDVKIHGFGTGSVILVDSVADGQALLGRLEFIGLAAGFAPVVVPTAAGAAIEVEAVTPCFVRGTGILTPTGYVPVETLAPGDPVVNFAGRVMPVRWVGRRTLDIAAQRRPAAVRPVVVRAGALAPGVPARAVALSPDHALLLLGRLVPAKLLVNGATIMRDQLCQAVTYVHVELDRHDVLLADGMAAESYIDTGNRNMFERAAGTPHFAPVFGRGRQWDAAAYADLCLGGPVLREIRRGVRARALALGFAPRTMTEVSLWVDGQKYLPAGGTVEQPIFRFAAPHAGRAVIRSAKFVPAEFGADETGGADDADDYRSLGVAISRVRLGGVGFAPRDVAVSGFYKRGRGDLADWTDGNAVIAVPAAVDSVGLVIAALPLGWVGG